MRNFLLDDDKKSPNVSVLTCGTTLFGMRPTFLLLEQKTYRAGFWRIIRQGCYDLLADSPLGEIFQDFQLEPKYYSFSIFLENVSWDGIIKEWKRDGGCLYCRGRREGDRSKKWRRERGTRGDKERGTRGKWRTRDGEKRTGIGLHVLGQRTDSTEHRSTTITPPIWRPSDIITWPLTMCRTHFSGRVTWHFQGL